MPRERINKICSIFTPSLSFFCSFHVFSYIVKLQLRLRASSMVHATTLHELGRFPVHHRTEGQMILQLNKCMTLDLLYFLV